MKETEIVADSHIEPTQTNEETLSETYAAFGITPKEAKEIDDAEHDEEGKSVNETPAKEDVKTETKKVTVKYNKEDVEIDEDKVPELLQKGLALDKEREKSKQSQLELDRAAKLLGFKDNADLTANLDRLEQQQQQQKQDDFDKLKADMRQEFIDSGFDPEKVDAYIENHPLMQKAREAVQKDEERIVQETLTKTKEQNQKAWDELYKEFPDIVESSQLFDEGKEPDWYNAEMKSRISKGYDPLDAYKLAHMSTLQTQTKKSGEQKAIKDLQLGNRSAVETVPMGGQEPQASEELRNAFSMFGLDPKRANKYVKK